MKFRNIKQRGQAIVFWALLTPLLILFVGFGIDMGWYYLTVSRLQNAADSAALAGAMKLVEKNQDLRDYYVYSLAGRPNDEFKPDSNGDYTLYFIDEENQYSSKKINETVDGQTTNTFSEGEKDAKKYANKNLSGTAETDEVSDLWNTIKKNNGVTFESGLYARKMDIDRKENGVKYYKVTLTEQVSHLFLGGFYPMEAKVVAYALLKPHDVDLVTIINQLEKTKVIGNWEYQKANHNSAEEWNHYRQTINGKKAVSYTNGDDFRTETLNIMKTAGDPNHSDWGSAGRMQDDAHINNKNAFYDEDKVNSLNIDFNIDICFSNSFSNADWDLRGWSTDTPPATIKYSDAAKSGGWSDAHGYDLRIQGLINFKDAWKNRNLTDADPSNNLDPDPLWVRIEGDPFWSDKRSNNTKNLDSVRQFIINVHENNTTTKTIQDANGNDKQVYEYRPFFIFYMGPEVNDKEKFEQSLNVTFSQDTFARKSQPVILNLYSDWNAIIYMPYSPVIINGNGHNLKGFVIAKEYLWCTEPEDYTNNGYRAVKDSNSGCTVFVKQTDLDNKTNGIVDALPTGYYRKIIYTKDNGDEETLYIKEESTADYNARRKDNKSSGKPYAQYYMEIVPGGSEGKDASGGDVQNKIIIDNKGDLQTKPKPLSDSSYGLTRPTKDPEEQPDDIMFNKKLTTLGVESDYRIPGLEVVYDKKRAFGLGDASYYSYFQIASLHRVVYTYLNVDELNGTKEYKYGSPYVDDMFFTTKRAKWID